MKDWADLATDGRRLNRIIRILEKRMNKSDDDDKIIRYANSISLLTREKISVAKLNLGIDEMLKKARSVTNEYK